MYLISRKETFVKLFFLLSISGLTMYVVLAFYTYNTGFFIYKTEESALKQQRFGIDMKYILLWTTPQFKHNLLIDGQQPFIQNKCSNVNCYVTTNKNLLKDVRNFNSIVFNINTLQNWKENIPTERSTMQKYVFFSMASANKHPVCNVKADNFFNWTWSYKLYSDIVTPFIEVRNLNGDVVTKLDSDWTATLEDSDRMDSTNNIDFKTKVKSEIASDDFKHNKSKAVMWLIEKCGLDMPDIAFAQQLKLELQSHSLDLDIYGCAFKKCPQGGCLKAVEKDYYFYLALEDSSSEDYVTTEVLKAYHHNAVPIVMGGADYTKFLPFDSFIDAQHESLERLAAVIQYTIRSPAAYKKYFYWKKFYTIHSTNVEKGYCDLCSMLNDDKRMMPSVYENFRKWWFYGSLQERCIPKGAELYNEVLSYINSTRG